MMSSAPSAPFVVFALPRSRTFWTSRFLSYGAWHCGHDEIRRMRSLDDVRSWLATPLTGSCETGGAPFWRTLAKLRPDAKVVIVRRPVEQVVTSLMRQAPFPEVPLRAEMTHLDRKLLQIAARWPGALMVSYGALVHEVVCKTIFEHCLGLPHDREWWQFCAALNQQANLLHELNYMVAHQKQIERCKRLVVCDTLADMMQRPLPQGDIVVQREDLETAIPDARALASRHALQGDGADPYAAYESAVASLRSRAHDGSLVFLSARKSGALVGYLGIACVTPTLAAPIQFYADARLPGVGRRLLTAALPALRERGVAELSMVSGPRGSGPRIESLYRRLGAEERGKHFVLKLMEA